MIQKNTSRANRVSIVIPVYNEAGHISACLEAIAVQTVAPYEVIVVDNDSTDGSITIARRYQFVKIVRENRRGVVYTRDRGFNAAQGEIIARIDADSLVPNDWVARISAFYSVKKHAAYAFSGAAAFYNVRFSRAVAWLYNCLAFDFNRLLIGHPTLWGSNMALTRRQWQTVRSQVCHRTGIHEDLDLAIHLKNNGFQIFYDRRTRVGAQLRRVRSNRHELWDYLQWWPRTLRQHDKRAWWVAWLFGCLLLYLLTPLLNLAEGIARLFGRPPLKED